MRVIRIVFAVAFAAITGYGIYANQKIDVMPDLLVSNIEAIASSNEYEPDNECSGCIINCLSICKMFGDWGGCIGNPYIHRT